MQVIYETLRLATVVNGLLRKTTQDVEMNGENPKGSILLLVAFLCKLQASSDAILCISFRVCYSKRLENLCLHKGDKLWPMPVSRTDGFQPMEMAGKEYSKQMFHIINMEQDLSQILTWWFLLPIGEGPGITSPLHVVWRRFPYVPREGSRNSWNCNFPSLFCHTIQVCFSHKSLKAKKTHKNSLLTTLWHWSCPADGRRKETTQYQSFREWQLQTGYISEFKITELARHFAKFR